MNKEDVLKLIQELNEKQTETICIEAKTAREGKPEKYYDTVSSFANTMGGTILFGVEEKKTKNKTEFIPVGVYDTNELQKHVTNFCSTEFVPVIRPRINIVDIDGKNIVAVEIDMLSQRSKPCYYKPKGLHNGSYVRVGDRDDNMTEYEIYKCISYKDNVRDDLRPVVRATIKDLDSKLLNRFLENAKADKPKLLEFSDEEILLNYGVLTEVEDKIFPNKKIQDKKIDKINKILEICKEEKSIKEIMQELGYKSSPTLRRDYIKPLLKNGKLVMTIPDNPTSKNQKYIVNNVLKDYKNN